MLTWVLQKSRKDLILFCFCSFVIVFCGSTANAESVDHKYCNQEKAIPLSIYFATQFYHLPLELADIVHIVDDNSDDTNVIENVLHRCGFCVTEEERSLDSICETAELGLFFFVKPQETAVTANVIIVVPEAKPRHYIYNTRMLTWMTPTEALDELGEGYKVFHVMLAEEKRSVYVTVEPTTIDLGDVLRANTYQAIFSAKNESLIPVRIGPVKTSCSCTSSKIGQPLLFSGETTEVILELNPKDRHGKAIFSASLNVSGQAESIPIDTIATIRDIISFYPGSIAFENWPKTEEKETSLKYRIDPYFGLNANYLSENCQLLTDKLIIERVVWEKDLKDPYSGELKMWLKIAEKSSDATIKDFMVVALDGKTISRIPIAGSLINEIQPSAQFAIMRLDETSHNWTGSVQLKFHSGSIGTITVSSDVPGLKSTTNELSPDEININLQINDPTHNLKGSRAKLLITEDEIDEKQEIVLVFPTTLASTK